jgi:hypothetical protein
MDFPMGRAIFALMERSFPGARRAEDACGGGGLFLWRWLVSLLFFFFFSAAPLFSCPKCVTAVPQGRVRAEVGLVLGFSGLILALGGLFWEWRTRRRSAPRRPSL